LHEVAPHLAVEDATKFDKAFVFLLQLGLIHICINE
jgi:hypothetical protein